jgi:hypothetical protein
MKENEINYVPAPLNGKDIMDDELFDDLFGYSEWTMNKSKVLGFIDGYPYLLIWEFGSNHIELHAIGEPKPLLREHLHDMLETNTQHIRMNHPVKGDDLTRCIHVWFYHNVTE